MVSVTIHHKASTILGTSADRPEPFFRSCIQAHERILAENRGPIRKNSPESAVTLVDVPGRPRVCVKELRWRGWSHALKGLLRPTQGLRTYRNGWKLIEAGVSVAAPLALVRRARFGVVKCEWIIMQVIPQALELDRYVLRQASRPWQREERVEFAQAFGRFIGGLHAKGIVHSDLKTCNILVSVVPSPPAREGRVRGASCPQADPMEAALEPAAPCFSLLDYDDVAFCRAVPVKKRIKNLVQIFLSTPLALGATDRMRFLRAYAEETGWSGGRSRELAAAVLAAARGRTILYVGFDGDVVEEWE